MQVKVLQNAPREHSAILSTFIKRPFVIKIFDLSIFEWPLKTDFTVLVFFGWCFFTQVGSKINNLLEIINARLWMYDEERENRLDAIPRSDCPSQPCSPCLGALVTTKYLYIPGKVYNT